MKKSRKDARPQIPQDFISLCESFQPRPIHDCAGYRATCKIIATFDDYQRRLTGDQRDYLELLQHIVERYECKISPASSPRPLQLLRQLVEEHRLRKSDLSRILGRSLSLGSMILSGQRKITEEHARRLGRHFGLQPEAFLA